MTGWTRGIASAGLPAYLRAVSLARLIRILTILAVVMSPIAMVAAPLSPAMAHDVAMSADGHQMAGHAMAGHEMLGDASMTVMSHCKGMAEKSKDQPCQSGDCQMACAAVPAIPAVGGQLEPHALTHDPLQQPALVSAPHGLEPEAATPPPRRS